MPPCRIAAASISAMIRRAIPSMRLAMCMAPSRKLLLVEEKIVEDIRRTGKPGPVIYLGDYIDRGADAAAVIDHLCRASPSGLRRATLCGNHEVMACAFLFSRQPDLDWVLSGGDQTLRSYGIPFEKPTRRPEAAAIALRNEARRRIPKEHVQFLIDLPLSIRTGPYLFVHAGIRPGVAIDDQVEDDLLWIREPFLSRGPQLPFTVIHGHTPVPQVDFAPVASVSTRGPGSRDG